MKVSFSFLFIYINLNYNFNLDEEYQIKQFLVFKRIKNSCSSKA